MRTDSKFCPVFPGIQRADQRPPCPLRSASWRGGERVTKSGTNTLHGSLREFLRNGNLNARNTFAPKHDSLKRNQFGGTGGGKIIRDKLFFFGGFQGTRQRSDPPQTTSYVPTAAVLGGNFSAIDSASCISAGAKSLRDPLNGGVFAGNQIPVSRLSPKAIALATKYLPRSNDPCGKIVYGIPATGDEEQIGKSALTTTAPGNWERAHTFSLSDNYTFSPTKVNAFHAIFSRRRDNRGVAPDYFNPKDLGLNVFAPIKNFTQISVNSYWSIGCGTCSPVHFNTNSLHLADDIDIIRGKHQISFGVDFLRDQFNFANGYQQNGVWTFAGAGTGPSTSDSLADFMLGLPSGFSQSNQLEFATRAPVFAAYAQDQIRVTSRFNINIGLRFEPSFAAYDYFGRGTSFNAANFYSGKRSTVFPNSPPGLLFYGDEGIPKGYFNNKIWLFSPRFGSVWDLKGNGKQTIRLSAAILRDT